MLTDRQLWDAWQSTRKGDRIYSTMEGLRAVAAAARAEALEEAAKACDASMFAGLPVPEYRRGWNGAKDYCATTIRALAARKEK